MTFRRMFATALAIVACLTFNQACKAASDCDVRIIKVKSVVIEKDKITIKAEAKVSMVIITPEAPKHGKSLQFTGRHSTFINMQADEATFVVHRPHPKIDHKAWTEMTIKTAEALKAGKEIGRIGYYRPDITIKKNRVHSIVGRAYIYPKRVKPGEVTDSVARGKAAQLTKDKRIESLKHRTSLFNNRPYWWVLPKEQPFKGFIRTAFRGKEGQQVTIAKPGWLHIAISTEEISQPKVTAFAREKCLEKTNLKIGYRVPLHADATPLTVYRMKVPAGELTIPRLDSAGPIILVP